mgnify:CR=1 FL=1
MTSRDPPLDATGFAFEHFFWRRLILDEAHELVTPKMAYERGTGYGRYSYSYGVSAIPPPICC